jgi:hypothetical protein
VRSLCANRSGIQLDVRDHQPTLRTIPGYLQILLPVAARLHEKTLFTCKTERAPRIGLQPQRKQPACHASEKPDRFRRQRCIGLLRDLHKKFDCKELQFSRLADHFVSPEHGLADPTLFFLTS